MQNYVFYSSNFNNMSESGMLNFEGAGISDKSESIPLYKEMPDWQRIVAEFDIREITGSVTFKGVTSVSVLDNLSSSSAKAVKQDGSTSFDSPEITTVGKYIVAVSRDSSSNTISNIGALLGFNAVLSASNISGSVTLLITK